MSHDSAGWRCSLAGPEAQIGEMEDLDRLRARQKREQQGDHER